MVQCGPAVAGPGRTEVMGAVTQHIIGMLIRQIEQEHIVIWYDPETDYSSVVDLLADDSTLLPSNVHLVRYDDSFFGLRHQVEPLLGGTEPPQLLVYVPLPREETGNALIEVETMGIVLDGHQSLLPR